jgi:thiamine-phosphate pyrophosphorylase
MSDYDISVLRILDANYNRASEGLRVVEDYLRMGLDDAHLCGLCKSLRHRLSDAMSAIPERYRWKARDTRSDVGTRISTVSEGRRQGIGAVVSASCHRVQQSLRCLEEYLKLVEPAAAVECESLRYEMYTLARAVESTALNCQRLSATQLYVIVDGRRSIEEFDTLLQQLVVAGVHAVQLRDKRLSDRELIQRARQLTKRTSDADVLAIINDRADIAALSHADGVHVGQDEMTVKDVRALVGPDCLIGVSTHSIDQARQAVLDGADYIGCGPVFQSSTKSFDSLVGTAFLREVAGEIRLPAFAIGGVSHRNVGEVLAAGFSRVAVSGAVCQADHPAGAVRSLLKLLRGAAFGG